MILDLLREYVALLIFSVITFGFVHIAIASVTGGNIIRPFIVSVHTSDFYGDRKKLVKFIYVAASGVIFATVSAASMGLSGSVAFITYSTFRSPAVAIFISVLPVLYLIFYVVSGVWDYGRNKRSTKTEPWREYLGVYYERRIREVRIADANYRATERYSETLITRR